MPIAIVILVILALAALALFATVNRRRATTGTLSRETRSRDASAPVAAAAEPGTEIEAAGRERAEDTKERLAGGVPAARGETAAVEWEPVDEEELGVSRRQFLNRGVLTVTGFSAGMLGIGVLGFLWPTGGGGGFGGRIRAPGSLDDILAGIAADKQPLYVPEAKSYLQAYPSAALDAARKVYPPSVVTGMEQGVTALYQRCVHLGCRVPWCHSSQWFECPCHGSKYNAVGEKKDGPAPRGLDRFAVIVEGGGVTIDTSTVFQGPPIGTDTTKQPQEGPSCI